MTLSEFADKINFLMKFIMKDFMRHHTQGYCNMKITMAQFYVMEHLMNSGGSTMSDVARLLNVTMPAITGIVDRLARGGYVVRMRDDSDRRIVKIALTSKGSDAVRKMVRHRKDMTMGLFGLISQPERMRYLKILSHLKEEVERKGVQTGKKIMVAVILASILAPSSYAYANDWAQFEKDAYISSMQSRKVLKIGLVDCVAMAMKDNSEIQVREIAPKIEDANVKTAYGKFDPSLGFDFSMEDNTDNSDNPLFGPNPTKLRTNSFGFGYDQTLISGTKLALDFDTTRNRSNYSERVQAVNPVFDSFATVTVTQPLLRGFGLTVTQADLLIARNNKLKSLQDFEEEVIKILSDVKKAYYDYQYSREQYDTAVISLKRVQDLHEINKEKYAKGLASNVDLLQSESEMARFEQAVASAEGALKLAEDNLKFITNIVNDPALWNADIELIGSIGYEAKKADVLESLDKAFGNRPDYEAARIDLKNKDINVVYYKNGTLPIVDVVGSYGFNGLAKTFEKDMGVLGSGMYEDWSIGVNVTMPLGNDDAKGKYQKSLLEKRQAIISFKRLEQRIILEVRNAVRDVGIKLRVLDASRKNKDAEIKNYEAQSARFKAGLVSTHDIIDFQEKLARAEVNYAASVIEYNKSLIELARAEGMTLAYDNIKIE